MTPACRVTVNGVFHGLALRADGTCLPGAATRWASWGWVLHVIHAHPMQPPVPGLTGVVQMSGHLMAGCPLHAPRAGYRRRTRRRAKRSLPGALGRPCG